MHIVFFASSFKDFSKDPQTSYQGKSAIAGSLHYVNGPNAAISFTLQLASKRQSINRPLLYVNDMGFFTSGLSELGTETSVKCYKDGHKMYLSSKMSRVENLELFSVW